MKDETIILLLIGVVALNIADFVTTDIAFRQEGFYERNPFYRHNFVIKMLWVTVFTTMWIPSYVYARKKSVRFGEIAFLLVLIVIFVLFAFCVMNNCLELLDLILCGDLHGITLITDLIELS